MHRFTLALVAALVGCGTDPELEPVFYPVEGYVGSCHIVCDYTQDPTVLRVETTPGNLMSCQECFDSLRDHFENYHCYPRVHTFDFDPEHCR